MKSISAASNPATRFPQPSTRRSAPVAKLPARPARSSPRPARSLQSVPGPKPKPIPNVRQLPTARSLPAWLRWLLRVQRSSVIVTFGLIVALLAIYGSTVHTQQLWSEEYGRLKQMQRNERQAIAANESLKAQLAAQAERPESGLVPKSMHSMVIVPAAPSRPLRAAPAAVPQPKSSPDRPLGY